jgi:hypothetical protein
MGTENSRVSIPVYYIIIEYILSIYSLSSIYTRFYATTTTSLLPLPKYPEWTCLRFVFVVQIQWDIWRLYFMETYTEQRWVLRTAECQSQYIILLYYMSYLSTLSPRSILASLLPLPTLCYRYQNIQNGLYSTLLTPA